MSEIKPALTAEEWAELFGPTVADHSRQKNRLDEMASWASDETSYGRHGTAAICLYGQPFGFTHADVELLHRGSSAIVSLASEGYGDQQEANAASDRMDDLADRIAALLPEKP